MEYKLITSYWETKNVENPLVIGMLNNMDLVEGNTYTLNFNKPIVIEVVEKEDNCITVSVVHNYLFKEA